MVARILIRYPYLIWLTGFLLPIMYLAYFLNINRIFHYLQRANLTILFLIAFTLIQLFSAFLSITYDFFTFERFIAILHNIVAFTFIFMGYAFMKDEKLRLHIKRYSYNVYCFTFLIILLATIISFYLKKEVILPSFFTLVGVESKFTEVKLNMLDWYVIGNFPRTQVMGIYPNSTGLLFIFLYLIVIILNFYEFSEWRKFMITTMLVIVCFITGSRAYLLLSVMFYLFLFIRNKSLLSVISFLVPFLIIATIIAVEYLSSLRSGSNDARAMIYEGSLNLMLDTNPFFGIGIKPRLPDVIGVPYPVGSHSAIWGYIIKCGLVGAIFMLIFIAIPVYKYMEMVILQLFSKKPFNKLNFFILSSSLIVIVALGMEDLDAFEILPLYFGMLLWIYDNRKALLV